VATELPAPTAGTAEPTLTAGRSPTMPSGPRILMVDDHPAKLLTYEAVLSGLGVECVRATSGHEALQKILIGGEFAVILLDVNMPGMDGFEVARLIREHPRLEKTPIIFVTAVHDSDVDRLRGYEVGAIDYICVPVAPEILRSKVAILVELYLRRTELLDINRALAEARQQMADQHARALQLSEAQHAAIRSEHAAIFEHPGILTTVLEAERDEKGAVRDWIYRNANASALKYMNRPREEVVGRRLTEIASDRAEQPSTDLKRVLQNGEVLRYETCWGGTESW
jgi:CheY-like chemotaxis protein